ncbi:MAG: hypothetical protein QOG51_688 [Verrucomicrobiota bacterium]|jgi:hypothetical protein
MKRILLAITVLVFLLPAVPQLEARTDVSIDFFYDNIGAGGNWVEVADYGYCWQPTISVSNRNWRPYSDGYWAYTDVGWTWVSYEDFGWATYHYGRWTRLRDRGWFWVPGREWGPSWVSWRTGGDYVGWAPLPPRRGGDVYDSRPITGQVDIEFDIGPLYYNFVDVRYIGEPVLRERIFAPEQNVTYITRTVNVTNITYSNSTVYNNGPDYNTLSRYSSRPIQRLTLQREANVDLSAAARSNSLMKVQGDKLMVAAPPVLEKPPTPIAPKVVKEKIDKPNFERGWTGDEKAQAELKQKIKAEDPKTIAPPTIKPRDGADVTQSPAASTGATATPPPSSPAASVRPAKDERRENASPGPSASVAASPGVSPATTPEKPKNRKNEKVAPVPTPAASLAPGASATPPPREKTEKPKRTEKAPVNPPSTSPPVAAEQNAPPSAPPQVKPEKKRENLRPTPLEPAKPDTDLPDGTKRKINPPVTEPPKPPTIPEPEARPRKNNPITQEHAAPPPGPAANAPVNPPGNPPENRSRDEGKKKKNEPVASPTPG